ncbi:hypothetical protein P154DRAFT_522870 [Amniculicola lignicola CBS 123094]|uniref:FAD-binding FR-type domain-containing protein n=1 Tax=Amniculicola lignicola CBS 123094 TaxID=1392246 RepID=A0A6A5WDW7_9PLEO|nr:hypothetical protein P154DRAFT_522870 [Amniculicola lignicola CBS 123094]
MGSIMLSWAQDALDFSLSAKPSYSSYASASEAGGIDVGDDPGKNPRFRPIVEAVLYSRRFMLTYNLVLLGILAVFTLWHWSEKIALIRRKNRAWSATGKNGSLGIEETEEETWSSSSSTIEGLSTPPDEQKQADATDEMSPLLPSAPTRRPKPLGYRRPDYILKSWMQYQPRPIPIIHKTLPSNSVSIFILSFLALNVFYNFHAIPMSFPYIFVFADRCGIVFVANLPLLYLLAAKNQPIKFLTGYSYESLNLFHRRVGELLCFEALLHCLGMFGVWYGMLRHLGFSLMRFLFNRLVGLGLGAFVAYQLLYLTSLGSFRRRCYEIFLALHIFLQIAGLLLLWFHYQTSRTYVFISILIFLIDRLVFRLWAKSSTHPATLTVLEDGETIMLSSDWDVAARSDFAPQSMKHGWKPNDHIFLTVPSLSNKYILQSHPFTIFSAAPVPSYPSDGESGHAWFSLLIRAQKASGFTRTLLDYARTHPKTHIRLDGPYGSSHALDILSSSDRAIVIAGGSGIAVAYPLLWALLNPELPSAVDIEATRSKTRQFKRKVKLLWIVHSTSHQSWIPDAKISELKQWGLEILIPPPTSEAGRPNVGTVLEDWVAKERERSGVVVSGPDGLVRDVRNTCAAFAGQGIDVNVQVEKFGW